MAAGPPPSMERRTGTGRIDNPRPTSLARVSIGRPGRYRWDMASPKETLEIAGHEVSISNPQKVYFPDAGVTKLDVVQYYLAVADGALTGVRGRPMALKRFVDGITKEPFFQKRAPDNTPGLDPPGRADLPVRTDGVRDRRGRRRGAGLDRQPRLHRPQSAPGPRRRPGPSRRAPGGPGPGPGRGLVADPRRRDGLQGSARSGRARGLAEDVRLARHPHQRADRASLDLSGGASGSPRAGP